jgi:hypothetical protein
MADSGSITRVKTVKAKISFFICDLNMIGKNILTPKGQTPFLNVPPGRNNFFCRIPPPLLQIIFSGLSVATIYIQD